MPVLEAANVAKKIGSRWIVEDLNMAVEPGEVYGFLGPNGAGKTTTIRMIVGLARPTRGSIRILGHDVQTDRAAALSAVGTIVENPETYRYLTGRENLIHYARLAGIDPGRRNRRIDEVVELVGLQGRIDDKVKRYSLGMRQRLGLAQALLAQPKLLVLDEPTNGLDPAGMREFRDLVRRLAEQGLAVFVSSHLLAEIQQMCDRVAILKNGRIIADGRVADLMVSGARGVHITVGHLSAAVSALQAAGFTTFPADSSTALQECGVVCIKVTQDAVPHAVRSLVAADIDVYAIEPERESLEDLFLQLTGDGAVSGQSGEDEIHG
jgi:ABC-2 type transport system ATP-binding protein